MSRILIELFNGNIEPHSKVEDNDPRCRNLRRLMESHLDTLETRLRGEEKSVFEKYNECLNEYEYLITERAFCDGFCLATRVVAEAMLFSEKQFSE